MENEFVTYEIALRMKAIGFNELCMGWYDFAFKNLVNRNYAKNSESWLKGEHCSAPTWQSAFNWFRDKYNLVVLPTVKEMPDYDEYLSLWYGFDISEYDGWRGGRRNTFSIDFESSLRQSEIACLEKLCEIVENRKKDEK